MNKKRSATAEQLYRNDARLDVRSAGTRPGAKRRISETDLLWADVIYVMEREHKQWITENFGEVKLPPIDILDVPDEFEFMDPNLQEMLVLSLNEDIKARLEQLN